MSMGLGAGYQMGGAVPPELGPHPLTLDFSPDPMHPALPRDILPPNRWHFDPKLWDSGLYALLALRQYAASQEWTNIQITDPKIIGWQTNNQMVRDEIEYLRSLMENDRAAYMAEILAQHDNAPFYWIAMLGMTNGSKPASLKLMQMAMRIGEMTAVFYKKKYERVRPSVVCPGLAPPFGPPGHPAFPSGHSLQGWLITYSFMEVTRPAIGGDSIYKEQLKWLAKRVATNRERAGLHYPSDSLAGRFLAQQIFDTLLKVNHNNLYDIFYQALQDAKAEWNV
ncbi:MAG: phosphatase PAP2 family protein [Reyranella sp.]|nr:phosphatase PAP2 family protein [Reyranella sp.]MDP3159556.1 phosphatase PAP2 family protein [Reyranella sp.]